jgi:hypothetical protein
MDMPGYLDYGKMMEMSPLAYNQAMAQMGLAQQFQAEKLKQTQMKSLADQMTNDQTSQMNPLLLEQRRGLNQGIGLDNTGKGIKNEDDGLTLQRNKAMQTNNLNADQRKAAIALTDDNIRQAEQHITEGLMSGDPARQRQALQAQQWLPVIMAERRKAADEAAKNKATNDTHVQTAKIAAEASKYGADQRLAGASNKASSPADFWGTFYTKLKTARDKHAALVAEASKLGPNDPQAQQMLQMAEAIRPQAQAEIDRAKPGAVDLNAQGIPVTPGADISPNRPKLGTAANPIVLK